MAQRNKTGEKMQKGRTATRRASQRSKARRRDDNRIMIALIIGVVVCFSTVIVTNINKSNQTLKDLKVQQTKLENQRDEQLKLAEELEEKELYVKTNAYVEEQARKMGLVYPDEVIFKPED